MFQIEDLKKEHALLSDVISKANAKIMNMTEDVSAKPSSDAELLHSQRLIKVVNVMLCTAGPQYVACLTYASQLAAAGAPNVLNILRHMQSQKSGVGSVSTKSRSVSVKL
jgi:hypothetical protein